MKTKTFLVTMTIDDTTRFLRTDEEIALQLAFIARSVATSASLGPTPQVAVDVHQPQQELAFPK